MMELVARHKIIIGIVVLLVGFGLWYGMSSPSSTGGNLTSVTPEGGGDQEIVSSLLALRSISLAGTIFSDPVFMSLKDFGVDIVAEPVGRPNPFAPFIPVTTVSPDTSRATSIFIPAKPTK